MEHNRKCLSLQHQPGPSDKPRKELSVLDSFPKRLVYYLMNRSRSLYSYAKNILEDIGYKGCKIKISLLILTILIRTPFDSDFKIVLLRIL